MNTALIVVDVQNDFIDGSLAVPDGEQVAARVAAMDKSVYSHVVATQDWHIAPGDHFVMTGGVPNYNTTWPVHCVAGTLGAELHQRLEDVHFDAKFRKGRFAASYSGFDGRWLGQDLEEWLQRRGVGTVDIVGIALDYCVKATALDAVKAGFNANVILPFTAAVAPASGGEAIHEMRKAGVRVHELASL